MLHAFALLKCSPIVSLFCSQETPNQKTVLVQMVPFASYINRGHSKLRLIFPGINGPSVARQVDRKCCQYYLNWSKFPQNICGNPLSLLKRINIDTIPKKVCIYLCHQKGSMQSRRILQCIFWKTFHDREVADTLYYQ